MIRFGPDICGDIEAAGRREWLETNGLGGFASSTLLGMNTRRYHGLLVAAVEPPVGRALLLSKLEETLVVDGQRYELAVNQYPGVYHPRGDRYLAGFRLDPFPIATYRVGGLRLEKTVFMAYGENTTVVQYRLAGRGRARQVRLELRPLLAFRDYHATIRECADLDPHIHVAAGLASVRPYPHLPALHLAHDADELETTGEWFRSFVFAVERERGFDDGDDLFSPFVLRACLDDRSQVSVVASTERRDAAEADALREAEIERRRALLAGAPADPFIRRLYLAADQFIVSRAAPDSPPGRSDSGSSGKTVIAGYHWFGDWGRDTMIALPGLTLATGRPDVARDILLTFARYVDRGMLPNRFPDGSEPPEYNTVDATLWFFEAIRALVEATGDVTFVREHLYDVLREIVDWHVRGTRYNIRVDADGLLAAGATGANLTWMDAKVEGVVITPRYGKAVEIQALWYNALRTMQDLAARFGDDAGGARYGEMADRARASFGARFWNEAGGCLYDVVDGEARDGTVRPNQILAVSLHHTMLDPHRAREVVAAVERELLTPFGLRSLAPGDPRYRGVYVGDWRARDSSYHQGPVWGWLLGPFLSAYARVHPGMEARAEARRLLEGVRAYVDDLGVGQIAEIFDGDAPHLPRGAWAQAWSVAETLRAAVELRQAAANLV